ncbi:MAG: PhzF family phenazine biosynthesis protein [Nitrospiraceae bacterium]|nr:PhzF family phenazine biosynthesis protein [Nitrospiraceae bacterium]
MRGCKPDLPALAAYERQHATTGITIFAREANGDAVVRSFAPADGIAEDPVCGSGNGAVAAYRRWSGSGDSDYAASQGREIGRDGVIGVRYEGEDIHVGGSCVTVIEGTVHI